MRNLAKFILILLVITSCSFLIDQSEKEKNAHLVDSPKLHLVFSHNISGETHPCGCRNFPLGGLPQIYGQFEKLKQTGEVFYVDTGDTFFPSSVIPETMHSSLGFGAKNLAKGLDLLGLKYIVPGDQDYALGASFLSEIDQENKFQALISNLNDPTLKSEDRFALLKRGQSKIYLLGIMHPTAVTSMANKLQEPISALKDLIRLIKSHGYDEKNPYHRLIVLSHSGIDEDQKFAESFPMIDWIIGSHSQSFLRYSVDVGKTKIVQALSKNHYLGSITIDLSLKNSDDTYELLEIRDELKDAVTPNPFISFIDEHKKEMTRLQISEQELIQHSSSENDAKEKFKSPNSCLSCHKPQVEFWQQTAHSQAYLTLIKAGEDKNLNCIQCHSHGLNQPSGFNTAKELFLDTNQKPIESPQYLKSLSEYAATFSSLRKLAPQKIKEISVKTTALDKKFNVQHNFSNVQCLNCHDKTMGHPFDIEQKSNTPMENKCMTCHTPDQSPEWYTNNKLNKDVYQAKVKKVACPQSK